jgi:hypothetical protein
VNPGPAHAEASTPRQEHASPRVWSREQAWKRIRLALERLRESVHETGATLVVAQAYREGPDGNGRLRRICRDLRLPYIDLVPALPADDGSLFFQYDGHWRPAGHATAARELAGALPHFLKVPE